MKHDFDFETYIFHALTLMMRNDENVHRLNRIILYDTHSFHLHM